MFFTDSWLKTRIIFVTRLISASLFTRCKRAFKYVQNVYGAVKNIYSTRFCSGHAYYQIKFACKNRNYLVLNISGNKPILKNLWRLVYFSISKKRHKIFNFLNLLKCRAASNAYWPSKFVCLILKRIGQQLWCWDKVFDHFEEMWQFFKVPKISKILKFKNFFSL